MGKSSKTPKYQGADYATGGLFGDSITTSKGTTYTPNENITMTGETAWSGLNNSLNNIASNDYSNDANFQAYQDALILFLQYQYLLFHYVRLYYKPLRPCPYE